MKTAQLIDQLTADLKPRRRGAAARRLAIGVAVGAACSAALIVLLLGTPLEAVGLTVIPAFTMKLLFAFSIAALGGVLLFASGRPGQTVGPRIYWLVVPPLVVALTAAMELAALPGPLRDDAWLGATWQTCLMSVSLLSLPVLFGTVWGFKLLAPTELRLAGSLAGLTSGATAAVLYALYCPETTATFLVSWYTLGIMVAGLIGAILGPRVLRW